MDTGAPHSPGNRWNRNGGKGQMGLAHAWFLSLPDNRERNLFQ